MSSFDLRRLREAIITALFSDDELLSQIVLKGGNALELVHGVVNRGSLDIDFSLEVDFEELERAGMQIRTALERRLARDSLHVFDFSFVEKPTVRREGSPAWWGGYLAEFKLVPLSIHRAIGDNLDSLRRNSLAIGEGLQRRTFSIDFSKHEYCGDKELRELDDFVIQVYSLKMIAAEKLRAICQQMPDYPHVSPKLKRERARDFYDISMIADRGEHLDNEDGVRLVRSIFTAKDVALSLLGRIAEARERHALGWPGVSTAVGPSAGEFAPYFERVCALGLRLLEVAREI